MFPLQSGSDGFSPVDTRPPDESVTHFVRTVNIRLGIHTVYFQLLKIWYCCQWPLGAWLASLAFH